MKNAQNHSLVFEQGYANQCSEKVALGAINKSVRRLTEQLRRYHQNYQQRQALSKLRNDQLKDVGLTYEQVQEEVNKAFWKS